MCPPAWSGSIEPTASKKQLQGYCKLAGTPFKDRQTKAELFELLKAAGFGASKGGASTNIKSSAQPSIAWLKPRLQDHCREAGIPFTSKHTKKELLALIQNAANESSSGSVSSSTKPRTPAGSDSRSNDTQDTASSNGSSSSSIDSGSSRSAASAARPTQQSEVRMYATRSSTSSVRTDASNASKVIETSRVLVCNVVGTTEDRKSGGWCKKWSKVTHRQPGTCAAVGCSEAGTQGGHVFMKGQPRTHCYIVPICYHHNNSQKYSYTAYNTEWYETKANTAFMRIKIQP